MKKVLTAMFCAALFCCTLTLAAHPSTLTQGTIPQMPLFEQAGGIVDTQYTLTVVNGTADSTVLAEGDTTIITAETRIGATFTNWTIDTAIVSTDSVYIYTMGDTNVTITANFEQLPPPPATYTLTIVNGTPDSAILTAGDTIVLIAEHRAGAFFTNWTIDTAIVSTDSIYTYTMADTNTTIIANFEAFVPPPPATYTLTVVNGTPDSAILAAGDTIVITAETRIGAAFTNWTIDSTIVSTDSVYTYTMVDTNTTITANFEPFVPPVVDPYDFTGFGSYAGINLEWNHDGVTKAYDVIRDGKKIGTVKPQGSETLTFFDDDVNLQYGVAYEYSIVSKQTKIASEKLLIALDERPFNYVDFAAAEPFVVPADSVAVDSPFVTVFDKPSFAAYYTDPAKGKTKKLALTADKEMFGTSSVAVYTKNEVALFNSKTYNKRTVFSHEYLLDTTFENGQLTALPMSVRVKNADAAHKGELRTFVEASFLPPAIEEIYSHDTGVSYVFEPARKLLVSIDSAIDCEITVSGLHFGAKTPKVWVESRDVKGKIKKTTLKVKKSARIAAGTDFPSCLTVVALPIEKWAKSAAKDKLPEFKSFVLSTGKAFDAIEFEIVK